MGVKWAEGWVRGSRDKDAGAQAERMEAWNSDSRFWWS